MRYNETTMTMKSSWPADERDHQLCTEWSRVVLAPRAVCFELHPITTHSYLLSSTWSLMCDNI